MTGVEVGTAEILLMGSIIAEELCYRSALFCHGTADSGLGAGHAAAVSLAALLPCKMHSVCLGGVSSGWPANLCSLKGRADKPFASSTNC